jgi:hypothetical protein
VNKIVTLLGGILLCSSVLFCGCVEDQNQYTSVKSSDDQVDTSKFVGTWKGSMEFSMFNWRDNTSASTVTELEFTEDALYMTMTLKNTTQVMENSYTIQGDQLLVSPIFTGDMPFDSPPFNGSERPPLDFNESQQPPFDVNQSERPFNGEPPSDGERPSRARSYTYSFSEDGMIIYLNGSPFTKET